VSSKCFEHSSVHPQENLYMQFHGISFMRPYKQSGRWKDVLDICDTLAIPWNYMFKSSCGWTLGCSKHVKDTI